jgi:hypothetical protein
LVAVLVAIHVLDRQPFVAPPSLLNAPKRVAQAVHACSLLREVLEPTLGEQLRSRA